ncbi:MAG TPA: thioredoxin [Verrucomicrobiales bacterium]|nr:thioredoxin [Verrucomicrobiales bacterium]
MALQLTSDNFDEEVLQSEVPVLVDFWAEWCGPCKAIAPTLEELDKELDGKVNVAKVNIDDNPDTPIKYGVRGIPTLILFKEGEISGTKVGSGVTKSQLISWIENCLSDKKDD